MREERAGNRYVTGQRMPGMILYPLAEIGIGMFVAVMISGGQFVMDLQRDRKGRHRKQECHQQQGDDRTGSDSGGTKRHAHPRVKRTGLMTRVL